MINTRHETRHALTAKKSDSPKTVRLNFYGDYSIVVMSLPNQVVDISASLPSCFIS